MDNRIEIPTPENVDQLSTQRGCFPLERVVDKRLYNGERPEPDSKSLFEHSTDENDPTWLEVEEKETLFPRDEFINSEEKAVVVNEARPDPSSHGRKCRRSCELSKMESKLKRARGEEYLGRGKGKYSKSRSKRSVKPRSCKHDGCRQLTEEDRNNLFTRFWELTREGKQVFIHRLVKMSSTKRARDRKTEGLTRRAVTFNYFFPTKDKILKVCKLFFLRTLDISEWSVCNWKKARVSSENPHDTDLYLV